MASATLGTMRLLGRMLSMGILTLILALLVGRVRLSMETAHLLLESMKLALWSFALLGVGGVLASPDRGRRGGVAGQGT